MIMSYAIKCHILFPSGSGYGGVVCKDGRRAQETTQLIEGK